MSVIKRDIDGARKDFMALFCLKAITALISRASRSSLYNLCFLLGLAFLQIANMLSYQKEK